MNEAEKRRGCQAEGSKGLRQPPEIRRMFDGFQKYLYVNSPQVD